MKSLGVRLCVGGLMVVRAGFVVGETRGARVLGGATTPLVTSFVGGDILDTGPSTVTAGCGETVSAWFATRCNTNDLFNYPPYSFLYLFRYFARRYIRVKSIMDTRDKRFSPIFFFFFLFFYYYI